MVNSPWKQARKEAQKVWARLPTGHDPLADKQEAKLRRVTLQQAYQDYLQTRKDLKPKTLYDYSRVMTIGFSDWLEQPLLFITKDQVAKRHTTLGEAHGEAYANLATRVLRALFNFAAASTKMGKAVR